MVNKTPKIVIIGGGAIGTAHAKHLASFGNGNLYGIADVRESRLAELQNEFSGIVTTTNHQDFATNPEVDAAIIATPSELHTSPALDFLNNRKHIFVEKPMTMDLSEAIQLEDTADSKGLILMTGHVLVYSQAIELIKEIIRSDMLGDLLYIRSERMNDNKSGREGKRNDDVLWDLASHEIYMVSEILNSNPTDFIIEEASGWAAGGNGTIDAAKINLRDGEGFPIRLLVSWNKGKSRNNESWTNHATLTVCGKKYTAVVENNWHGNNLLIKETTPEVLRRVEKGQYPLQREHVGREDHVRPHFLRNPYEEELRHFIDCITNGITPRSSGSHGREVVKLIEEIQERIAYS